MKRKDIVLNKENLLICLTVIFSLAILVTSLLGVFRAIDFKLTTVLDLAFLSVISCLNFILRRDKSCNKRGIAALIAFILIFVLFVCAIVIFVLN